MNQKKKKGIEKGKNELLIWNWVLKTHQLHLLFWWNESLLHSCDPQPFSNLIASSTNIKCSKFSFITNDLIINFQYHKICELQIAKLTWIIYIWSVFFIYDVLMWNMCDFCVLNVHIHICHLKTMFHLFEYLKYWIHTNIIHFNHNMVFIRFMYEPMKIKICMEFVQTYEA